ncbi:MAG: 3,4-dihydroxyphthalate decarboxylase [Chloroflexota bacterium]|jgi:ribulose-5-phosphate 4-epimerase/fuculose-1-phosphate aldolase|nr:3,4-dihydroxyphthalate decarboxylase [Chloroflexota bacterium]
MAEATQTAQEDPALLDELREKVATSCRILAQHAVLKGSMGHVSTRVPGTNDILVRGRPPIDPGLRFCEPSSIIRVGADARPIGATRGVKRVSEIYLHTEVYKRRPDINAVIHAHAPWTRLCTICNIPLQTIYFEATPLRMLDEGIPIYSRSITLHTLEETAPMMEVMGDHDICILNRHGVVVAGSSVEDVTNKIIELEHIARNNYLASLVGEVTEIPAEDKAESKRRSIATAQARARGEPDLLHPGGEDDDGRGERDGSWTYYKALLDSGALYVNETSLGV